MSRRLIPAVLLLISACGNTYMVPEAGPGAPSAQPVAAQAQLPAPRSRAQGLADFRRAAPRVEQTAEAFCREELPGRPANHCDFEIRLIDDRRAPPNAFQTRARDGSPLIVITSTLIAQTGSADEIAFVLSHEAGHHIADHLTRQQTQQMAGALIFGAIAGMSGEGGRAGEQRVAEAQNLGAFLGGRAYSQSFELEADVVGAYIAARAGYDPERGALIFARPALAQSSASLLSTHPPSPRRLATVGRTTQEIRRQQAAGLTPRPAQAPRRF